MWSHTPVSPAVRRLRQENGEFKANLGFISRPWLKTPNISHWIHASKRRMLPCKALGKRQEAQILGYDDVKSLC
jgi:chloramphenicol O-acetyltransferase